MQKILVVEDYQEVSDFLALALTGNAAYEVVAAKNGDDAVSLLERHHPDLALVDIRIPGIRGMEIGRRALAIDVPVVLMTGDLSVSDRLAENGIPHLLKPFPLAALFAAVRRELSRAAEYRWKLSQSLARLAANKEAMSIAREEAARIVIDIRRARQRRGKMLEAAPLTGLIDIEHWRARAEKARVIADKLTYFGDKQSMLDIAAHYDQLAEFAERQLGRSNSNIETEG
jgi:DNA-binding response OmpR family regulator